MQLPIGIFGVAIGVVALAQASKDVSANDNALFHRNIEHAMNYGWLLTMPCAVGLWVMARPIVALLFGRGAFTAFDTEAVAKPFSFMHWDCLFTRVSKSRGRFSLPATWQESPW
ncbi:MAG: lipid II flippase MurJ [Bdellovibrionota bacterium]